MFDSSELAEAAFYEAFSSARLDDMMRVWASDDDVVCIHPGGPRLAGITDIRASWRQIFIDSMPRSFTLRGRMISGDGNQRIHILEENIRVPGTNFAAPPVLATNIYRRQADGWRMVLHHASVAPHGLRLKEVDGPPPAAGKPRLH